MVYFIFEARIDELLLLTVMPCLHKCFDCLLYEAVQQPKHHQLNGFKSRVLCSVDAPGGTGFYNSNFSSKAATIAGCFIDQGYEFGFLHVKAVDDTGHDRFVSLKVPYPLSCSGCPAAHRCMLLVL